MGATLPVLKDAPAVGTAFDKPRTIAHFQQIARDSQDILPEATASPMRIRVERSRAVFEFFDLLLLLIDNLPQFRCRRVAAAASASRTASVSVSACEAADSSDLRRIGLGLNRDWINIVTTSVYGAVNIVAGCRYCGLTTRARARLQLIVGILRELGSVWIDCRHVTYCYVFWHFLAIAESRTYDPCLP